jgi:hypothetical protein
MIEGIEPYYRQIGESISESIREPWDSAWMTAVFYPQHVDYSGEFLPAGGGSAKSYPTGVEARRAFEGLREMFKQAGKPVWCRARFEMNSSGKFNLKWGYDDADENGFARFDAEEELKRKRELRKRMLG